MGSLGSLSSRNEEELLIQNVSEIYNNLSTLQSLKPSKDVNTLFTQLVLTCIPPSPIDVTKLSITDQGIRSELIRLCGEAEGLLEAHYSTLLGSYDNPLDHINTFPYYTNYVKLGRLEYTILSNYITNPNPNHIAFIGSGPMPLTSLYNLFFNKETTKTIKLLLIRTPQCSSVKICSKREQKNNCSNPYKLLKVYDDMSYVTHPPLNELCNSALTYGYNLLLRALGLTECHFRLIKLTMKKIQFMGTIYDYLTARSGFSVDCHG